MRTGKMRAAGVVGAAIAVAIVWLQAGTVSGRPMTQGPEPSQASWFIGRMFASPYATAQVTELVGVDPNDLSMGTPWRLHDMSTAMLMLWVTVNLEAEILPRDANDYVVPIVYDGATIAALSVERSTETTSGWQVRTITGGDQAHALDDLQPTDRILFWPPLHWFAVRGDLVIPLGMRARYIVAQPVTLSEFQAIVNVDTMACPEGKMCGSGGVISAGAQPDHASIGGPGLHRWVPLVGVATCLAGGMWLVARRQVAVNIALPHQKRR